MAMACFANAQAPSAAQVTWPGESDIIYDKPDGEDVTDVIGKNFSLIYDSGNLYMQQTYNGIASYVKGADGNLYVLNPIPGYRSNSYLKLEPVGDGRYVAHTPQAIDYDEGDMIYVMRMAVSYDGGSAQILPDVKEDGTVDTDIYFTYSEGVLRQQRAEGETFGNPKALLGIVLRGGTFLGTGVSELTVMPSPYHLTTLPEGLTPKPYGFDYTTRQNEKLSAQAEVAIDGNTVYISDPENPGKGYWIKGSYADGRIVVEPQYVGADESWGLHYFLVPGKLRQAEDGTHLDLADKIELTFDEAAGTITSADDCLYAITADITGGKLLEAYFHPTYSRVDLKPAVPAAPEFYDVGSYSPSFGREVKFNLPSKDVDGNPISANRLSYRVYMGPESVYTFTTDKYVKLSQPMSLVSYNFSDDYDFPLAYGDYHRFYLYEENVDGLGIQSVYTVDGVTNESGITWWMAATGIGRTDAATAPVRTEYFDLQGRSVSSPRGGLYVVKSTMPDGSVVTRKQVVR